MNNLTDLEKMIEAFNQLDRENQITAMNLIRSLHINTEDEKAHIDLRDTKEEAKP